ncbi:hypothetical protein [Sanguibacter sp. 25GB23B1]|uniref:hypothetical protein n=1 Tax=unclassified Sanguibacter TaxID=2645534 RepID=UPI0032AE8AE1
MSEQDHRGRRASDPARTPELSRTPGPGAPRRPSTEPRKPAASDAGSDASTRRFPGPPWLPWVIGGVVAVVVVVLVVLGLDRDDSPGSSSTPSPVEVVGAVPTPVAEPVVRGEGSALFLSLPDSVRQYVVTEIAPSEAFAAAAALESVTATYTGPLDGAEVGYTVTVGQWPTPAEAAANAAAVVAAAGEPISSGEVTVAGAPAGTYSIHGVDDTLSTVVWTNGTLLLQATGPAADIENFYLAYSF